MGHSQDSRLAGWVRRRRLDRIAAGVGLVAAVLALPLRTVVSHIYATTLPVVLVVASVLYLWATRTETTLSYPLPTVSRAGARVAEAVVLFGVSGLFVGAAALGQRTLPFLAAAALVTGALLAQVVFTPESALRPGVVLFEALSLALVIRFAGLYSVSGFVGVDVWSHMQFVSAIREQGTLAALDTKYVAAPLYHLLVAGVADVAGVSRRSALYVTVGLVVVLSAGLVYYGCRRFVGARWALVATVLFATSAQSIRWGLHLIPTSLGLAFYTAGFPFLVRVLQEYRRRDVAMLVFFVVAITLTHQLSAFVTVVTFGIAFAVQVLVRSDRLAPEATPVDVKGLLAFATGFVVLDWSVTPYSGGSFTSVMLRRLRNTLFRQVGLFQVSSSKNLSSTAGEAGTPLLVRFIAYVNVLGFLLLLCLGVVGGYYVLRRQHRTHATVTHLVTVATMGLVVLGLPILGVSIFLPGRWYAFMYVPMVAVGALGLRYVVHNVGPRTAATVLLVILLVYPATMLVAGAATLDNPVFAARQPRYSFTETEVTGVQTIGDVTTAETPPVYTDAPYTAVFRRTGAHDAAVITVPRGGHAQNQLVVYREYLSDGAPIVRTPGGGTRIAQVSRARACGPGRSVLYTNGNVVLCRGDDAG